MVKLTGRTGKSSSIKNRGNVPKRPVSSAPKKQYKYTPKTVRDTKVTRGVSTSPVRQSYKKPTIRNTKATSLGSTSAFVLRMKILRALMLKYRVIIIIVICFFVLLGCGVFAYFTFFVDKEKTEQVNESTQEPVEEDYPNEFEPILAEGDDSLAAGYDESDIDATGQENNGILEEEQVFIGVTIGDPDEYEKILLQKMEEAINEEYKNGTLGGDCVPYDSDGDINQQIHDIRSLANIGAKAVIVCATSEDEYIVITDMAKEKGIKVVAVDAPIDSGYDVNIVTNFEDFGQKNAEFISENIGKGNLIQFIDTEGNLIQTKTLVSLNEKLAQFSNVNINGTVDMSNVSRVSKGYEEIKENGTIEAIYAENGIALSVLNELIETEQLPKVFVGDGTAGFIKKWYELATTGVTITREAEDDDEVDKEVLVQSSGMKIYAKPTPYGAAAAAVKFAIRLSKGMELDPEMISADKTYYYTGSISIVESVLPYYYKMIKDKDDNFIINDWPTDYEIDQYFIDGGGSYYDTDELKTASVQESQEVENNDDDTEPAQEETETDEQTIEQDQIEVESDETKSAE